MLGKATRKKNCKGFSLIEIMVAVFFVSVGLIGVLAFFNASLKSNFDAKNELIAAGLAQEGAELVRNKVEFHTLDPAGSGWTDAVNLVHGCTNIDYRSLSGSTHPCDNGNVNVCFNGARYQQCPGGTDTEINRDLEIHCFDENDSEVPNCNPSSSVKSLRIKVDVKWNDRATTANDIIYENNY